MKSLHPGKIHPALIAFLLLLVVIVLASWLLLGKKGNESQESQSPSPTLPQAQGTVAELPAPAGVPTPPTITTLPQTALTDPSSLMAELQSALAEKSLPRIKALFSAAQTDATLDAHLKELIAATDGESLKIREVGELEINKKTRWAISTKDSEAEYTLDLTKNAAGEWTIEHLTSPHLTTHSTTPELHTQNDSLAVADHFIKALVNKNLNQALNWANRKSISDARIASLCIMFEEGKYKLQTRKPLRSLFLREGIAAYMVNVKAQDGQETGQFGLTLENSSRRGWQVTDINLDSLLSDYIQRVAGGDAYYTPLVENPEGGDTLALYFDTDDQSLSLRAEKQLLIIVQLLQTDPTKKLTLSGHADAIGSDTYNDSLSLQRAQNVKRYLTQQNISEDQISIIAYGESKPRRKNDTDQGRRANRRAEIYLDF